MQCNVGKTDRVLRVIAGVGILILGLMFQSWWGLIGLIPLATASMSWCPLYLPLGMSTCHASSSEDKST